MLQRIFPLDFDHFISLTQARLGYHATVAYCGALEAKCRSLEGTPMHQSQLTIAQELVRKVQAERDQLQKEKEELLKTLEAKENIISAHEIALEERGKIISGKNKDLKTADKLLNDFKEKLQSLRAESKTKEGEWKHKRASFVATDFWGWAEIARYPQVRGFQSQGGENQFFLTGNKACGSESGRPLRPSAIWTPR